MLGRMDFLRFGPMPYDFVGDDGQSISLRCVIVETSWEGERAWFSMTVPDGVEDEPERMETVWRLAEAALMDRLPPRRGVA